MKSLAYDKMQWIEHQKGYLLADVCLVLYVS